MNLSISVNFVLSEFGMKGNHQRTLWLFLVCFFMWVIPAQAQLEYESEKELKEAAEEYFVSRDWAKAKPLYAQLLSLYPQDPAYNYRFGACVLYADKDKQEALKFLGIATRKPNVDPEAFYYLGQAYHLNYQFNDAITNYTKFRNKQPKPAPDQNPSRQIQMCKNGIKLLGDIKDIAVIDKQTIGDRDFFRIYDLKGIGGKVVVKPDEFKTKYDKKQDETSIMYIPPNPDVVYFSSYGSKGSDGKDIFYVRKLPSGEWGQPNRLPSPINTEYDEDYPFMHPDGKTLYFCSKGHNSMGGYDVFKSEYNEYSGSWSKPENLDFAFSSPDDDILFISDEDNAFAYFASKRSAGAGKISVYKVKVSRRPANYTIIKGSFIAEDRPEMKDAVIKVYDHQFNELLGEFKTKSTDGEYLLSFPGNGGKYKITVETTDDAPVHSGVVELPMLTEFRPLKQELRLVGTGDDEKLVIKNMFEEELADNVDRMELMREIIKKQSNLDINSSESEALASEIAGGDSVDMKVSDYQYTNMSNEDLISSAEKEAVELENETAALKNEMNYAYNAAKEKSEEASGIFAQSEKLEASINDNMSAEEQQEIKQQVIDLKKKGGQLAAEAVIANDVARSLESEYTEKQIDARNARAMANMVRTSINNGDRDNAIVKYQELQDRMKELQLGKPAMEQEKDLALEQAATARAKSDKAYEFMDGLKEREQSLKNKQRRLEIELKNAKKKKDQERIQNELNTVQIDLEDIQLDVQRAEENAIALKKDLQLFESKNRFTDDLYSDITLNGPDYGQDFTDQQKQALIRSLDYFQQNDLVGEFDETLASTFQLNEGSYGMKEYGSKHNNELAAVDRITDPVERANKRKEINEQWLADIDSDIADKKQALENATTLEEKVKLQEDINLLEEQRDVKQKDLEDDQQAIDNALASNESSNTSGNDTTDSGNETGDNSSSELADNNTSQENGTDSESGNESGSNESGNNTEEGNNGSQTTADNENNTTSGNESGNDQNEGARPQTQDFINNTEDNYENKLAAVENEDDPGVKAQSEAAIYDEWSKKLKEEAIVKKLELIESQNPDERQQIKEEIAMLESVSDEKKEKSDQLIAEYGEPDEQIAEQATLTKEERIKKRLDEMPVITAVKDGDVQDYNSQYEELVAEANQEEDQEIKETLLHNIYENWAETTNEEIEYRKETKDNLKKKEQKKEDELIAALESEQQERNNLAGQHEPVELVASNNGGNSTEETPVIDDKGNFVDYGSKREDELAQTEEIADEYEKNRKLGEISYQWYKNTQEEIRIRESNLASMSGSKRAKEEETITALKSDAEARLSQANYYQGIAQQVKERREQEQLAATNPEEGGGSASFNSVEAKSRLDRAKKVNNEITALQYELDETNKAFNTAETEEERADLQDKSDDLKDQIKAKEIEKLELAVQANQLEFDNDNPTASALSKRSNSDDQDVILADLKMEEASAFMKAASEKISEAENTTDLNKKNRLLAEALDNQKTAVRKQKEALATYIDEGGPDVAALVDNGSLETDGGNDGNETAFVDNEVSNESGNESGNSTTENGSENITSGNNETTTGGNNQSAGNETGTDSGQNTTDNNQLVADNNQNENTTDGGNADSGNNTTDGGNEESGNNGTDNNSNALAENNNTQESGTDSQNNEGSNTNTTSGGNTTDSGTSEEVPTVDNVLADADQGKSASFGGPADIPRYKARKRKEQAQADKDKADDLRDQAANAKRKDRKALIEEAEKLEQEADQKLKEAEVLDAEADSLNNIAEQEKQATASTDSENNESPELSAEEQALLDALGADGIAQLKQTEDYNKYKSLQTRKRRLVKEADVEYERSRELKAEARRQKELLDELKSLKNQAETDEDNAELDEQIEIVSNRIGVLNSTSDDLMSSSVQKRQEIASLDRQIEDITNKAGSTLAANMEAVEKNDYVNNDTEILAFNDGGSDTTDGGQETITTDGGNDTASDSGNETTDSGNETTTGGNENTLANNGGNETTSDNTSESGNTTETGNDSGNETTFTEGGNDTQGGNENTLTDNANDTGTDNGNTGNDGSSGNAPSSFNSPNLNEIPTVLLDDYFVVASRSQSAYNSSKPIKEATQMPKGIVWAVQVGAFRNPIKQSTFKGFAPVFAHPLSNGITRYTAGMFKTFDKADEAKDKIRGMGYSDAFVVAYRDGKQISASAARESQGEQEVASNEGTQNTDGNQTETGNTGGSNQAANVNASYPTDNDGATPVDRIQGVFFTVQVGVYSKPAPSSAFGGLRPLNRETTSSGYYRYTYGRYDNIDDARKAKQKAINAGVSDAFITAYRNGKKIAVSDAMILLGGGQDNNDTQEVQPDNTNDNTNDNTQEPEDNTPLGELEFKVNIGEYQDEVPVNIAAIYLQLTKRGIRSEDLGATTRYTIGSFDNYNDAKKLKEEMVSLGIDNAAVMVKEDGKVRDLQEVLKKLGNQ